MSFKLLATLLVCGYLLYSTAILLSAERRAKITVAGTTPYRSQGAHTHSMLVAGDSTAYGVGASAAEFSVPGRLGIALDASVENFSRSGALTKEVVGQLQSAKQSRYDLVLLQVGANDVIFFSSLSGTEQNLREVLKIAKQKSDRVLLLTAGDIGNAELFPWPLSTIISYRTRLLRERFMRVCAEYGVVYVDIYARIDPFASDPQKYYAPDGLHLSDSGYEFWFGIVREYVEQNWPELVRTS